MYYPCSEIKGADQLRGYREADLRLFFRLCRLLVFSRGGSNIFFQNLKTEKQMIDKIENEVSRVRAELMEGGHRPDDISKDTGALTTELAKKDRELMAKVYCHAFH